ncbi:MAG TPA: PAS domain-containing protein [Polyangia bacterium]|nr:PAS domain-containing protein [Polyangia bacterium]
MARSALHPDPQAAAVDAWGIGLFEWHHAEGRFTASPRFRELYGLPQAEGESAPAWATVHPDDQPKTDAALRRAMNPEGDGRLNIVHRVVHPGGKVLWLHQRAHTRFHEVGGRLRPFQTLGSVIDVTERQQIEQELRRSESRIEEAVRGAQFGIFEHNHLEDPLAENCYWSPRFREMLGAPDDEPGSMRWIVDRVPADDLERLMPMVARAHDPAGDGYYDVEHRYQHPTLGLRWLLTRSSTYFGEVGGRRVPVRTVGAVLDTTARRKIEQEQQQRSEILDATSDFVAMAEPDGRLVYLNRAGRELLGIDAGADLAGHALHGAHAPSSLRRLIDDALPAAAREGVWRGEAELVRHDGAVLPMSQVLLSHRGRDGQVVLYSTIARDISRERQLEESMRQSQKMEAIGRLAGGIAHDFNNMLCALLGLAHLASSRMSPGGEAHGELQEIIGITERAAALTQQLLAFSRQQVLHPRVVDVGAVLTRMTPMIRRLVGEHIEVTVSLPPGASPRVKVDPSHLEQVVLNLAINAGDAMEHGGQLGIACGLREVSAAHAARLELAPGPYAVIQVSDDGMGMDAQTRARVFEPFFTTKGAGHGTGLGLATVFGIIKQSGGNVFVDSEVGRGSLFEAYVPSSDDPLTDEPPASRESNGRNDGALILVAEDERSVRQVVVRVLERAGYRVIDAPDARVALMLAREQEGPIDLLLTDVVMPRLSGKELARQLCAERPGLRVLYMSGYPNESIAQRGVVDAGVHLLAKPVTPDQLLTAVAEALNRA